jgi:putative transposase
MIVSTFRHLAPASTLLSWVNLSGSVYYYKNKEGKRGVKPSTHTFKLDGSMVENQVIIEEIKDILSQEFCCYGYENVTGELRKLDYHINEKKVYRLMDEQNLLLGKVIRTSGNRRFVQHRKIAASYPMEYLCLDIKYIYVHADRRNYYLLTILDVFSRRTVDQIFQKSIRQMDVINAFRRIKQQYGIKGVTIRNDNGSQFIANSVNSIFELQKLTRSSLMWLHRKRTPTSKPFIALFSERWWTATSFTAFITQSTSWQRTDPGMTTAEITA